MSSIELVVAGAQTERDSVRWRHLGLAVSDTALQSVHVLFHLVIIIRIGVFSQSFLIFLELHPELFKTALVLVRCMVVVVDSLSENIEVQIATCS